jgi:hypothetical protein
MRNKWTKEKAFAFFNGAKGKNRYSWSALSADGPTIVLALWEHEFETVNGVTTYEPLSAKICEWCHKPGNKERIEHLKLALDRCNGRIRVVKVIAKDENAHEKKIKCCCPVCDLIMKITRFCKFCGDFRAEAITELPNARARPQNSN